MGHSTDLKPASSAVNADSPDTSDFAETVAHVLSRLADHFTDTRPTEPMEQGTLLVGISAQAYTVCGRSIGSRAAHITRAALRCAPAQPDGITRGEYALHVRRTLGTEPTLVGPHAARAAKPESK